MTKSVTIVGAGWAGLAAAVELSKNNITVNVYESSKQLGGRARNIDKNGLSLDNGQHLMIGAYQQMLEILKTVGIFEKDVFYRIPQAIKMLDLKKNKTAFYLKLPEYPAPLNLLLGILLCPSLSFTEKLKTLYHFNKLIHKKIHRDLSVDTWLEQAKLPVKYTDYLLKPLCLAALNTHTHEASAKTFQTVLQQTFNGPASHTDLLIAKRNLGDIFPQAAKKYIESKGGKIFTEHRISKLSFNNNRISSIIVNDNAINIEHLILATPHHATSKLLSSENNCSSICQKLDLIKHEPVTTVYLQYPENIKLPMPMMGIINATCEWIFDRQYCNQPGLIACIISASGAHININKQTLASQIALELKQLFPHWPEVKSFTVIREKRASFRCLTDIDSIRPNITTPIKNLKLCGDYVYIEEKNQAGLPSTLEGALRSGVKCAQITIQDCL